ncbi:GTPase IMAP family member 7-like isoform X1 [Micropterus dolomieu]|uniref:GTPase IMAP family member 7-like isoform X1 n=1 Tax=Micropterus dolomieu TaxID=147949 RepID=UPI001E8E418E|nr:GTPase IMAP family member 7-like isoform X1 [Micropterus dolomieu]
MDGSNRRIVLLGKTEVGKSSLANTIFGEELFDIDQSLNSETRKCQAETKSVSGRGITLIDTPGFFDTDRSEEELKSEIVSCITKCAPGPHAFLIVLKVEKVTEQEQAVINKISQYFSEEAFKYATVVFTHGDQLREGWKIEDFVCKNKFMNDLVKKCGGRCHIVDNKYWNKIPKDKYRSNRFQVEELLNTIDKMVMENNGSCYTNEMLQAVEKKIQEEEEQIRCLSKNKRETREQGKVTMFKRLLIQVAGAAKGALFGAFIGVVLSGVVISSMPLSALAFALVGAVIKGFREYIKAEGEDTQQEAASGAAMADKNEAQSVLDEAKNVSD